MSYFIHLKIEIPQLKSNMHMRRFGLFFLAVSLTLSLFGQNTLTVHQRDGGIFSFGFDDKPVVTFTDAALVVKTDRSEIQYSLSTILKFTFDVFETVVDDIREDSKSSISLDDYMVLISGTKPGLSVRLVTSGGQLMKDYKTDSDGNLSFSVEELPAGVYVISSESINLKIMKK